MRIYFHLKRIKTIRPHLDDATCAKAIHAVISSRLDCNNALLVGLPAKTISRLQIAQNSAARLLSGTNRRQHITPVLKNLHWLPVNERIQFKSLCLMYKAVHLEISPSYIRSMISLYKTSRQLRSSNDHSRLQVPVSRTITYGQQMFSLTVSRWWNNLSLSLRSMNFSCFKSNLKTFLFRNTFD